MNLDAAAAQPVLFDHQPGTARSSPQPNWQAWLRATARPPAGSGPALRVADLFSGCGGLSLGVWEACRRAGRAFEPVLAWDTDPRALGVYRANFKLPEGRALSLPIEEVLGDSPTARGLEVLAQLQGLKGKVDIVVAGPPCQGHSNLNNHSRRSDGRNGLYQLVARFAAIVEPKWLLIENVPTVILDRGKNMSKTRKILEQQGYVVDDDIVRLDRLGVPQYRKRHLMIATDGHVVQVQKLSGASPALGPSVMWAIGDLQDRKSTTAIDYRSRLSPENEARIAYFFEDEHRNEFDLPDEFRPPCHRDKAHSYPSMYGRMRPDQPAQTITTGFLSPGQGRYIHPTRARTLTPHEAARLQFFPDWFDFSSVTNPTRLAKMIGNAVPMMLSFAAVERLLSQHTAPVLDAGAGLPVGLAARSA